MFYVHQTDAFRKACTAARLQIDPLLQRLQNHNNRFTPGSIPFGEPLGRGFYRFRQDPYRLMARLLTPNSENRLAMPTVCLLEVVHRGSRHAHGNMGPEQFDQQFREVINKEMESMRQACDALADSLDPSTHSFEKLELLPDMYARWGQAWPRDRSWPIFHTARFEERLQYLFANHQVTAPGEMHGALAVIVGIVEESIKSLPLVGDAECILLPTKMDAVTYLCGVAARIDDEPFLLLFDYITPADHAALESAQQTWSKIRQQVRGDGNGQTPIVGRNELYDAVARQAVKSYPSILVYDADLWSSQMTAERSTKLALSSEELQTLERALSGEEMPLFLEGRAGSGKTTTLFYYFANIIAQAHNPLWEGEKRWIEQTPPLFVTQSEELCKEARTQVTRLTDVLSKYMELNVRINADVVCQTFHQFCLASLMPAERARFAERTWEGGYLNAARFRALYTGKGVPKKWAKHVFKGRKIPGTTPELVWFVIRSYIKGYLFDEVDPYLDPVGYESDVIPDAKHVSNEIFQDIYHQVWVNWYSPLTVADTPNNPPLFWDDQDLVRAVLQNALPNPPKFTAIVCDEAQDFTRVEMRVAQLGLIFADYDLSHVERNFHLPLFLAGDPFQTINPSGFRWEGIKDTLQRVLAGRLQTPHDIRIHEKELQYNYRCYPPIAKLANAVQLLRMKRLGYKPKPQLLWNPDTLANPVARMVLQVGPALPGQAASNHADIDLRTLLHKGMSCIVPEEVDDFFWTETLGQANIPEKDVQEKSKLNTPEQVKGLEHSKIILLGFGAYFAKLFQHNTKQAWSEGRADDPRTSFQFEYFLNRLYVAVTRAMHELTIVDTPDGFALFWDRFAEHTQSWLQEHADWQGLTECRFTTVTSERLSMTVEEHRNSARDYEESASFNNDAGLYQNAAKDYQSAGDRVAAMRCKAHALALMGDLPEAARIMRDVVQDYGSALAWYWDSASWAEVVETAALLQENRSIWENRKALAEAMLQPSNDPGWLQIIEEGLRKQLDLMAQRTPRGGRWPAQATWSKLVLEFAQRVEQTPNLPASTALQYWSILKELRQDAFPELPQGQLATIAFLAKQMSEAVRGWEEADDTAHVRYAEAKALCTPYPHNLKHWNSAHKPERIVAEFERNGAQWATLPNFDERELLRKSAMSTQHYAHAVVGYALDTGDDFREVADAWCRLRRSDQRPLPTLGELLQQVELNLRQPEYFRNHFRYDERRVANNAFNLAVSLSVFVSHPDQQHIAEALRDDIVERFAELWATGHAEHLFQRLGKLVDVPLLWQSVMPLLDLLAARIVATTFAGPNIDEMRLRDYAMFLFELLWETPDENDPRRDESSHQSITPLHSRRSRFPADVWERLQNRLLDAIGLGHKGWIADRDKHVEADKPFLKLKGRTVGMVETLMQEMSYPELYQRLTDKEADNYLRKGRAIEESWYINHASRYYQGLARGVWPPDKEAIVAQRQAETQERKNRRDEYRLYRPSNDGIREYIEPETRVRLEYDSEGLLSIFTHRGRRGQFDCDLRRLGSHDRGLRWRRLDDEDEPQHVYYLETDEADPLTVVEVRYDKHMAQSPVWIRCGRRVVRVER